MVSINNDDIPEVDERFSVQLQSPSGGSRIGGSGAVVITILTNDDAHGMIRFAQVLTINTEQSSILLYILSA